MERVEVEVVSARGLVAFRHADPADATGSGGAAPDAFAKALLVTAKGTHIPKQSGRTATRNQSSDPVWTEVLTLGETLAKTAALSGASVMSNLTRFRIYRRSRTGLRACLSDVMFWVTQSASALFFSAPGTPFSGRGAGLRRVVGHRHVRGTLPRRHRPRRARGGRLGCGYGH